MTDAVRLVNVESGVAHAEGEPGRTLCGADASELEREWGESFSDDLTCGRCRARVDAWARRLCDEFFAEPAP